MSLGLNDLKKRASAPAKKEENWSRPTKTARPWTASGLEKPKKTRRAQPAGAYMNAEWATEHTSSLQAFDMEVPSPLTQFRDLQLSLKEQAIEIERKLKRAAMSPFEIAKSVLRLVQK